MARILHFSKGPDDWKPLLADPKHWRTGYSARTLAHCYEAADGLPAEIADAFRASSEPDFVGIEPILAIPEFKVHLPGGKRASQNDVFVLARSGDGQPVVIMVEGKVKESFGPTVKEWEEKQTDGRKKRLRFLRETLGLPKVKGSIRYQLLHRAASALITGVQYRAAAAVLCVHSFDVQAKSGTQAGWNDYVAFAELFGTQAEPGKVQRLPGNTAVALFGLWVAGDLNYTKR